MFLGPFAPASVGDYLAGPSHVLPTYGSARFGSALTVDDFVKQVHFVSIDRAALERVGPFVETLADTEGFDAHATSIRLRLASHVHRHVGKLVEKHRDRHADPEKP